VPSFLPVKHSMKTNTRSGARGFTLVELVITVGMISVVMVGATAIMPGMLSSSRSDGSAFLLLDTMRLARDRAIGERRNMDLIFTAPNRVQVSREEIDLTAPVGTPIVRTPIMDVYLEGNQKFAFLSATGDTPDLFGLTNAPWAFVPAVSTTAPIMFTSEGTLVNGSGDPINGTLFLMTGADVTTARAVTIFGPTAMVRLWKWNGKKWAE
jgi:prepilin-type N-terminal cleavage/methylation domain-containing protein